MNFSLKNKQIQQIIFQKQAKIVSFLLILVFLFDFLFFPFTVIANEIKVETKLDEKQSVISNISENIIIKQSSSHTITAYTSEVGQTDDTPCITANGFNVCQHGIEDTIATNYLPFGSKVMIPDLFGNRVFIVRDRMNRRYPDRFDIWMINKRDAITFGVKLAKIEVIE